MVPNPTRRRVLTGVSLAGIASLAGCINSAGGGTDDTVTNTTSSNRSTTEQTSTDTETTTNDGEDVGSPTETVRSYIETRSTDPLAARQYFHPIHPFQSDRVDSDTARELLSLDGKIADISLDTREQDVSPKTVVSTPLLEAANVNQETVANVLEGTQTSLVEATVVKASGDRRTHHILTVAPKGRWLILAQGVEPTGGPTDPFGGRIVTDVTFDTTDNRARVYFDDSLTADRITAKARERHSERSSSTPEAISYFDVRLDPSGDELIVTANVDGETRPIHREQYPPSERLVDDITYIDDPENGSYDAAFRLTVNEVNSNERIAINTTVAEEALIRENLSQGTHLDIGANPSGDEVIVILGEESQSEIVHRERHVFE